MANPSASTLQIARGVRARDEEVRRVLNGNAIFELARYARELDGRGKTWRLAANPAEPVPERGTGSYQKAYPRHEGDSARPTQRPSRTLDESAAGLLGLLEERLRSIIRDEIGCLAEAASTTPEGWMSVDTAAAYLDLTPAALRARVARGEVTAHRLGN